MTLQRRTVIALSAIALLAALYWGFRPGPVVIEAAEVARAPLELTVSEEGETRLLRRYRVDAPVGGIVSRIDLEVGDALESGDLVATVAPGESPLLDPRRRAEAEATLSRAKAAEALTGQELEAARAAADLARTDLDRLTALYQQGDVSQSTLDNAAMTARRQDALARSAEFAVQVARHEREAAEAVLEAAEAGHETPIEVRSPVAGRVMRVYRESRGPVQPAEPLVEVGDPASLEVQVDVLSSDAVRIRPEMTVRFQRWGGDQPLQGTVKRVEPVGFTKVSALGVEEQRVLVICDIVSDDPARSRLGDGYRVEAEFVLWSAPDVLQVPTASLFKDEDGWAVFVIENERARRRPVEPGHRSGLRSEVRSGLSVGEWVVAHPGDTVSEGTRVTWPEKG